MIKFSNSKINCKIDYYLICTCFQLYLKELFDNFLWKISNFSNLRNEFLWNFSMQCFRTFLNFQSSLLSNCKLTEIFFLYNYNFLDKRKARKKIHHNHSDNHKFRYKHLLDLEKYLVGCYIENSLLAWSLLEKRKRKTNKRFSFTFDFFI